MLSRVAFFVAAIGGVVVLPFELKIASALLLIVRYLVMALVTRKCAERVGESGLAVWEPIFDFVEPWARFIIRATQRERISIWR